MMRRALLAVIATTSVASAQPSDPYGDPTPAPAPAPAPAPEPTQDDVLHEQIADSLVQRAQELYDARVFVDAKQLAVEALVTSPQGQSAAHAKFLIASINKQLGIVDPGDKPADKVDTTPIVKAPIEQVPPEPEGGATWKTNAARVHGGLYVGLLGTAIGSLFSKKTPAGGAIPVGIAGAAAGGYFAPMLTDRIGWNEAQVLTVGAGSVWGGTIGGLIADAVKTEGTTARQVLLGSTIGSTVGLLAGAGLAARDNYTTGDLALVDTFAGIGAVGGLTMGMLMQPAQSEAYSVNSILGVAGGVIVGLVAAPNTNTTPRRMIRVAGLAAAGGAVPFLLYAGIHDPSTKADERVTGLLSSAGLVVGAYLGFRLTRDMDVDLDVLPGKKTAPDDAPVAMVGRQSDGRWTLGMLGIQPLSPELAPQPGLAMPLVGGAF